MPRLQIFMNHVKSLRKYASDQCQMYLQYRPRISGSPLYAVSAPEVMVSALRLMLAVRCQRVNRQVSDV